MITLQTKTVKPCSDLQEIRDNIDRLDGEITKLLVERTAFVIQAANFKETRDDVRIPERIEFIVDRVRALASSLGGDPDLIESVYRHLMEESIAREEVNWDTLNKG